MKNVDYTKNETPEAYVCSECGVGGVKLWREYSTFNPDLLCFFCAIKQQEEGDVYSINDQGLWRGHFGIAKTDQIANRVPAIPDKEGVGYWGYTSVPEDGIEWWQNLPNGKENVVIDEADQLTLVRWKATVVDPVTKEESFAKLFSFKNNFGTQFFAMSKTLGGHVIDMALTEKMNDGKYYLEYDQQGIPIYQGLSPDWPKLR